MLLRTSARVICFVCEVAWFFALLSAIAQPAQAYVDPGSGLLIYQITGSLFTGILFVLRKRMRQLLRAFSRRRNEATQCEAVPPAPSPEGANAARNSDLK